MHTFARITFLFCLGAGTIAQAQTAQVSTEADAISGTVTKTALGIFPDTITIAAVDPAPSPSGSSNTQAASASQNILGVEVYNFSNIWDITNDTAADATTGDGSLLGGLVTWTSINNPMGCVPDGENASQIDCSSTEGFHALTINGVAVLTGTYPAGSSFPVNGTINDPQCLLGTETFSGTLTIQDSQITGQGTNTLSYNLTGLHLAGLATCRTLNLVPLYITSYDLKVAGAIFNDAVSATSGEVLTIFATLPYVVVEQ